MPSAPWPIVNALPADARALPQLVRHDDWDHHLHATSPEAPLADRMAVEAAMALVDVVRVDALDRLRTCVTDGRQSRPDPEPPP